MKYSSCLKNVDWYSVKICRHIKWIWVFWLIGCVPAFGQMRLKAGCYKDLKPTGPLVLDTGSYTFIGLAFKSSFGGFRGPWLDARKARKIELLHCTFEGKDEATAVLSSGDLTVSHCMFNHMKEGILQASPPGSVRKVAITNNVFRDNLVSVRLEVDKAYNTFESEMDRNKDPNTKVSALFAGENTQQRRWGRRPTKANSLPGRNTNLFSRYFTHWSCRNLNLVGGQQ